MKKNLLLATLVSTALCTGAYGQKFVAAGSVIGGGGISFVSGTEKGEFSGSTFEESHTTIGIDPGAMFFITDDLGVGAAIGLSTSSSKDKDGGSFESSSTSISFGPMVRYYFAEGPFGQASFGFGSQTSSSTSGGSTFDSKYGISAWEAGLGYSVRITDTILLDPMVGYGSTKQNNKDSDSSTTFGAIFIRVGFTMVIVRK